jgi:hypothetical protein
VSSETRRNFTSPSEDTLHRGMIVTRRLRLCRRRRNQKRRHSIETAQRLPMTMPTIAPTLRLAPEASGDDRFVDKVALLVRTAMMADFRRGVGRLEDREGERSAVS